jgi:hypothetical protein
MLYALHRLIVINQHQFFHNATSLFYQPFPPYPPPPSPSLSSTHLILIPVRVIPGGFGGPACLALLIVFEIRFRVSELSQHPLG